MFKTVTLEMSLKPFFKTDDAFVENVCRNMFFQWYTLIKNAEHISVMLWVADGSEILDYAQDLTQEFEWCKYIGNANNVEKWNKELDPDFNCLYWHNHIYCNNPPKFTYAILKNIVGIIKKVAKEVFKDSHISVGTTFDPGCEFAVSDFKYNRHNEACVGGNGHLLCCYANLNADNYNYAAYKNGIEAKTPIGTFLGAQCNIYLKDMGFDYIWLSNGFGFGTEPWSTTGATFDGEKFIEDKFEITTKHVSGFWEKFLFECKDVQVRTRGTNFSVGIDYATDGVPFAKIYSMSNRILPPPNSPWAALDGDFGLELMGYMTRIACVPDKEFMFRFYVHDPWWANSPWYDRYEGQPHDIYLPLTISRIDENGTVCGPSDLSLLTVDNSFGEMPDLCAAEPIGHLLKAGMEMPDAPPVIVWLYPFEEYSSAKNTDKLREMFAYDWTIRTAINNGLPLSGVVSVDNFIKNKKNNNELYEGSIILSPVPNADSEIETIILKYVEDGGRVIFYGSTALASKRFMDFFHLEHIKGSEGIFDFKGKLSDIVRNFPTKIKHKSLTGNGLLIEKIEDEYENLAFAFADKYTLGVNMGNAVWIRATSSNEYVKGVRLLQTDDASEFCCSELLFRTALSKFGFDIRFLRESQTEKTPVVMIGRHKNAYKFSIYSPVTSVETQMKFPLGLPILIGYDALIKDGYASYRFPRAEHRECRVFVEQEEGVVSCREIPPVSVQFRRRIQVSGLKNATVRFIGEDYCQKNITAVLNSNVDMYFVGDDFDYSYKYSEGEWYYEARNITGAIVFSMPKKEEE